MIYKTCVDVLELVSDTCDSCLVGLRQLTVAQRSRPTSQRLTTSLRPHSITTYRQR